MPINIKLLILDFKSFKLKFVFLTGVTELIKMKLSNCLD